MINSFDKFTERVSDNEIKKIWNSHRELKKNFRFFYHDLLKYNKPNILEFGVRHGVSTSLFLDVCNQKNGFLYSIDINDYSKKFDNKNWIFICSEDNNFLKIETQIPDKFDVIFLDTIHKANHVNEIFYYYYKKLKQGGLFIIDDISWLPYVKNASDDHFFKEVNNKETFEKLLSIYKYNSEKFNIHFNFCDTGAAKIIKISNKDLEKSKKLHFRDFSLKNFLRKFLIIFKKN